MISGSVRDAEKPIIIVAPGGLPSVWLRVRGSHDVQSSLFTAAHQQDGYPDATESRCSLSTIQKSLLDGGVHTRLLEVTLQITTVRVRPERCKRRKGFRVKRAPERITK